LVTLVGKQWKKDEILRRVGHLHQIAGVRLLELQDGIERGVRIADVRTGSGLRFQVSIDRGMDISLAEYKGVSLAWRSAAGDVHPAFYDPEGIEWLRSFPGGLMTTCGMSQAGAPCTDEGKKLGLHGRVSNIPAHEFGSSDEWQENECTIRVTGAVRESTIFGENLLLRRQIECKLGSSIVSVTDRVKNEAFKESPLMMLYHMNLGWPLVDEESKLLLNARRSDARDDVAGEGIENARAFSSPVKGYREQVYFHELQSDGKGFSAALLFNQRLALAFFVRFRQKELTRFTEWKMMGEGTYVVGLEPANCLTRGRSEERKNGTLEFLKPGEEREFYLQFGILECPDSINHFIQMNGLS